MSVANLWKLTAVVTPGGQISQITDQEYDTGLDEMLLSGSGQTDPTFAAVGQAMPMLGFTTTAIASALGICGLSAYAITSATDFYFGRVDQGGALASGAVHIKLTCTKGILLPRTLEASQGNDPATISYDLWPVSTDGTTAPIAIAVNQSLPVINGVTEAFTVGPVGINASTLQAVQSVKWDFNLKEEVVASDGHAYATFAGVVDRHPKCEINGLDIAALSTFGLNGLALTAFKTYFRKIAKGGTRVADATTQHIRLQGTDGMLLPRGAKGKDKKPLQGDWNICPTFDGTNDIVAISTGAAIT